MQKIKSCSSHHTGLPENVQETVEPRYYQFGSSTPISKGEIVKESLDSFIGNCVRNTSLSLSFTFNENNEVEHHIRKKTCKLIVLKFYITDGDNSLYGLDSDFIDVLSI